MIVKYFTLWSMYCLKIVTAILFCLVALPAFAQYYLRGQVKNTQGQPLPFAKIRLNSKGAALFSSGSTGGFGIPLSQKTDSMTVMLDGYETLTTQVSAIAFENIVLKPLEALTQHKRQRADHDD